MRELDDDSDGVVSYMELFEVQIYSQ